MGGCGCSGGSNPNGGVVTLPGSGGTYRNSGNGGNGGSGSSSDQYGDSGNFSFGRFCFKCTTFWVIIAIGVFILITRRS